MAQRRWRPWLRFTGSAAILALLLALIPLRELRDALTRVPLNVLVACFVIFLAGHVTAALKWRLLQGGNTGLSIVTMLRAHFFGVIANLWLPSVVGGDLVRAGSVFRHSTRPALVAVASLVDRVIDSIALMLLAAGGLLWIGAPAQGARKVLLAVAAASVLGGLALVGVYRYVKSRHNGPRAEQLVEAVDLIAGRPAFVGISLVISVGVQATFILINVNLGRAVGMTAPVAAWFLVWPLAKLAALLPVSVGGLGVREAALIVLMRPFGDAASTVMAAGLLWQALFMVGGILGWCALSCVPDAAPVGGERLQSSDT